MDNYLDIIIAPIITEKTAGMEADGKYAFKVLNKANTGMTNKYKKAIVTLEKGSTISFD